MFLKTVPVNFLFTAARTSHSWRQNNWWFLADEWVVSAVAYYFWNHILIYFLSYLLSPWSRVVLERVNGFQVFSQSRNSPHFMEPEVSLPHSQVPAICPYPEPPRSSPFRIMYCLYLQKYLNMCRNIFVSTVQLVCSNVFLSAVMHLYLKWIT
jgi:hypothetical protein